MLLLLSRFSRVRLCETPWTAAHQAPLSMGLSRQEYWSGLPLPWPIILLGMSKYNQTFGTYFWTTLLLFKLNKVIYHYHSLACINTSKSLVNFYPYNNHCSDFYNQNSFCLFLYFCFWLLFLNVESHPHHYIYVYISVGHSFLLLSGITL